MARLFILGAGFSHRGGLPLGKDLFPEIFKISKQTNIYNNILKIDIDRFLAYLLDTVGKQIPESKINIEDFLAFLDIENFLKLKGSERYYDDGDRSQKVVRNLIGKILFSRLENIKYDQLPEYEKFAKALMPNDIVMTFNYDTLLETILDRIDKPYRLFPHRDGNKSDRIENRDLGSEEVVIYKMHGSIDWFDDTRYRHIREAWDSQGADPNAYEHKIFSNKAIFKPKHLLAGSVHEDSSLKNVFRISNLAEYYSGPPDASESPVIMAPSRYKILYSEVLADLWYSWGETRFFEHVYIIGYSMPQDDEHVKQVLYSISSRKKSDDEPPKVMKLKVVDSQKNEDDENIFRNNYRFLDWTKAEAFFDGFNTDALKFMFES
jgi:hypothetical protein